jgi:hypothetical protein
MLIPLSRRVPILVEPVVVHIGATHEAGITKKMKINTAKIAFAKQLRSFGSK